jgi:alkyl hydroperoxide reductase subunit D
MSLDSLKARIPDYAKDIKLNLGGVLTPGHLSETQVWGTALASAIAARNAEVTAVIAAEAKAKLSPQIYAAAQTAAAVMAMNNIYYRFTHLLPEGGYGKLPARLRMNAIATHGIEKRDFELFSLAVSAINGCGLCLESHEREVLAKGASREQVQDAVRIAAAIHAAATVLDAETAIGEEARAAA